MAGLCPSQRTTTRAGVVHGSLQVSAGAHGWPKLSMGIDLAYRHAIETHQLGNEVVERVQRCGGGGLLFVVAKHHHADIVGVVVFDMGTLKRQRASLPDPTSRVDDEVIADVSPAVGVDMHPTDRLDSLG